MTPRLDGAPVTRGRPSKSPGYFPMTLAAEHALVRAARSGDPDARTRLATRYEGYVRSEARRFARGSEERRHELIQEGFYGLFWALSKFQPGRRLRFLTYASSWVRAGMTRYLLVSRGPVRMVARGHQRAFFRLGRARRECDRLGLDTTPERLGELVGAPARDVAEFLAAGQSKRVVDAPIGLGGGSQEILVDSSNPEEQVAAAEYAGFARRQVAAALAELNERSRLVVRLRKLTEPAWTLKQIGGKLGLSRERVRQLEAEALGRMRQSMAAAGGAP